MSTKSLICIEQEDGSFKGIYCHYDGYLDYNGRMLLEYYNDRKTVEKLISLGDMSSLNKHIVPNPKYTHSFDKPQIDVCVFYGRDRGEEDTNARIISFENAKESWCEYMYVFGRDDNWRYTTLYADEPTWLNVKEELIRHNILVNQDEICEEL